MVTDVMRVLWVTNMWPDRERRWYGAFVRSQAESLRQLDVELEVVYIPGYRSRYEYLRGASVLRSALRRSEFDLVHAHYGHSGVIGRLQARLPLVISYCGDDLLGTQNGDRMGRVTPASRGLARGFAQLARVAQATITKSAVMANRLPRACRTRNHVIPNGVDLQLFAPVHGDDARQRLGWKSALPNVLFVGDPSVPVKNFRFAQAVCNELAERGRPVELRVARDVDPADMPVWMSAADALLFTSLSEGSPNAIKEAMAAELPVVSVPVGDVRERLAGVPGTFVVEPTIRTMANAMEMALKVGRTPAARNAIEDLSLERVAQRVLTVYRSVTA